MCMVVACPCAFKMLSMANNTDYYSMQMMAVCLLALSRQTLQVKVSWQTSRMSVMEIVGYGSMKRHELLSGFTVMVVLASCCMSSAVFGKASLPNLGGDPSGL